MKPLRYINKELLNATIDGYWLSPPSYYYTDEKNLLILETRLEILEDVKSHITKFINDQQSSK